MDESWPNNDLDNDDTKGIFGFVILVQAGIQKPTEKAETKFLSDDEQVCVVVKEKLLSCINT